MKTTLELPDPLMRQVKIRAASQGRKLKDVVTELIQRGLEFSGRQKAQTTPVIEQDKKRGLPVLKAIPDAPAAKSIAKQLLELERSALEEDDLRHAGLSL